jgi:hypothetical protein
MTTIHGILTTAALCLAAGLSTSCQSVSAEIPAERYVRQMPYSPLRDAELEKSSRKLVEELQKPIDKGKFKYEDRHPTTGKRSYCGVVIPDDAPPRPNAQAVWCDGKWVF